MTPKARVQKRLYYKIGEACKALGIQPYVLRYWETEFPALSPSKSRSGQRVYSEKELEIIRRIKQLLYDEGYTIAGAKKKLEGELAAGTLGDLATAAPVAPQPSTPPQPTPPQPPAPQAAPPAPVGVHPAPASPAAVHPAESSPGPAPVRVVAGVVPTGPLRAVPLPLVPEAKATAAGPGAGASAAAASGVAVGKAPSTARSTAAGAAAAAAAAEAWSEPDEDQQTLPPPPAAAPAAGSGSSPHAMPTPAADHAPIGPAGPRRAARPAAPADPPPAAAAPAVALDTDAAKQIETLRKGITKALQEAREILALLDSRSPQ